MAQDATSLDGHVLVDHVRDADAVSIEAGRAVADRRDPGQCVSVAPSYQESSPPIRPRLADVGGARGSRRDDRLRLGEVHWHHGVRPPLDSRRVLASQSSSGALADDPILDLAADVAPPAALVRLAGQNITAIVSSHDAG